MKVFRINWTQDGFTDIDAEDEEHARRSFDNMTAPERRDYGDTSVMEVYQVEELQQTDDPGIVEPFTLKDVREELL